MKIAIIDDEKVWIKKTYQEINQYLNLQQKSAHIISIFTSGEAFLEQSEAFDMVFMDIEMEGMDGFKTTIAYKHLFPKSLVCILTTHDEFSCIGYKVNAFRYIKKEQMKEEIPEALCSGIKVLEKDQKISFHIVNIGEIKLELNEIVFMETFKRNMLIHTRTKQYISNCTLAHIEQEYGKYGFFSIHKSILVNLDAITYIDNKNRKIHLYNGSIVTASRQKIPELKKRYLEHKSEYGNG